jgi:hypothetical protein
MSNDTVYRRSLAQIRSIRRAEMKSEVHVGPIVTIDLPEELLQLLQPLHVNVSGRGKYPQLLMWNMDDRDACSLARHVPVEQ